MRALIYSELVDEFTDDPDKVLGDNGDIRIYQASALGQQGMPSMPKKPFLVIRQMTTDRYEQVKDTSQAARMPFQLYCYDLRGSYSRIDDIFVRCATRIDGAEGKRSPSGVFCFQSLWLGVSQDYTDEQYDAIAKFANIQMSANQASKVIP